MADEEDFSKIPVEDRVVHKDWKARVHGYEECSKIFSRIDDPRSPEYDKFTGLVKSFPADTNAAAQVKGLEATLAFVENAAAVSRVSSDVAAAIVAKCFNATKPGIKEKAVDVLLMMVEADKADPIMEQLIKGIDNKAPKIAAGSLAAIARCLHDFGARVVNIKPLLKLIGKPFAHTDKAVRDEAKALCVELYRWLGEALKPSLGEIKPVQLKELEDAFAALPSEPVAPVRLRREEQAKAAAAASAGGPAGSAAGPGAAAAAAPAIDPYELLEAVDIVSKIPKSFAEDVENPKWSIRKDALTAVLALVELPKIADGDFSELVRILKKVVGKDSNVVNVALAAKCLAGLATGLRKAFAQHSLQCIDTLLEKFKEKKAAVVSALHDALNAMAPFVPLEKMSEDLVTALNNKNPDIKQQTAQFLARSIRVTPACLGKPLVKVFVPVLIDKLNDSAEPVRDAAAEALASVLKVVGERPMAQYLDPIDKIKADKIRGIAEKVVLGPAGASIASKDDAGAAPPAPSAAAAGPASKPATRPATAASGSGASVATAALAAARAKPAAAAEPKTKAAAKPSARPATAAAASTAKKGLATEVTEPTFPEMSLGEAESRAGSLITADIAPQLAADAWKERLEGTTALCTALEARDDLDAGDVLAVVLVLEARTKGWKDSNFQVMSQVCKIVSVLADHAAPAFPDRCLPTLVPGFVEKFADAKVRGPAGLALLAIGESIGINTVSLRVCAAATGHKSPKVQAETLGWLTEALTAFGLRIAAKPHVEFARSCLAATNPAVRTAAISFLTQLRMYVPALPSLLEGEKPALVATLTEKFAEVESTKPPAATRTERSGTSKANAVPAAAAESQATAAAAARSKQAEEDALDELIPRVDISAQIAAQTYTDLADKAWKVRGEALESVVAAVKAAKRVQPSLGDLGPALKLRLADANKNLACTACGIVASLAAAMGSSIKKYVSTFLPELLALLADAKDSTRASAIAAMDAMCNEGGVGSFLETDNLCASLGGGKPNEQRELLAWLTARVPQDPTHAGAKALLKPVFACVEDRNADVRKAAQELVAAMARSMGAAKVKQAAAQLKPASQAAIAAAIDKAAAAPAPVSGAQNAAPAAAPAAAQPATAAAAPVAREAAASAVTESGVKEKEKKPAAKSAGAAAPARSKSSADVEPLDASLIDDGKRGQREKDEKALKVLKWNFAAPRPEYLTQLQEQARSCCTKALFGLLFGDDFRGHVKALDVLSEQCKASEATVGPNVDWLLKWVTLRFFDTNTAVLLRTLQFLQDLFEMTARTRFEMSDYEAAAFLPYLINKIGDKIEGVRRDTHALLRLVAQCYAPSKIFAFVMEGLKSKNAKQRAECLIEMEFLVTTHGMSVCQAQVQPAKVMKAVATQVADRDNGVRSAALDFVVCVHVVIGDDVFKLMGPIPDMCTDLITERIKRTGKKPDAGGPAGGGAAAAAPVAASALPRAASKTSTLPAASSSVALPSIPREFNLDLDSLQLGALSVDLMPALMPTDAEDLFTSSADQGPGSSNSGAPADAPSAGPDRGIEDLAARIRSHTPATAIQALKVAEDMCRNSAGALAGQVDVLVHACVDQLHTTFAEHMPAADPKLATDCSRLRKHVLSALLHCMNLPALAAAVGEAALGRLVHQLLACVLDPQLDALEEGPQVVRCLNFLTLRLLVNADRNACFTVLVQQLGDAVVGGAHTRQAELLVKCLLQLARSLATSLDGLRVDQLLLDVHRFLTAHPPGVWKQRQDDTPLRAMKTILSQLAKVMGAAVLSHLGLVGGGPTDSTVGAYLTLKLSKDGIDPETAPAAAPAPKEKENVETLSKRLEGIFKMIVSKDDTKRGLQELSAFHKAHPSIDVMPLYKQQSSFIQSYITRHTGIGAIAAAETASAAPVSRIPGPSAGPADSFSNPTAANYMERLRALTTRTTVAAPMAAAPMAAVPALAIPSAMADRPLEPELPEVKSDPPVLQRRENTLAGPPPAASLDALKARLARMQRNADA